MSHVRNILTHWGPGKFHAEMVLDGKGFRPDGQTSAVLIPPAFGMAGVNLHTWTGWGSVTHWNAFVANIEMHGKGRFYDLRLNDSKQFPIAAKNGFGNIQIAPQDDLVTSKLAPLQLYRLSLRAPKADRNAFDAGVGRGEELFVGKARCNNCHVKPLWTSQAGICTPVPRSASTISRQTVPLTDATGRHPWPVCSRIRKAGSTTTDVLRFNRCRESLRHLPGSGPFSGGKTGFN